MENNYTIFNNFVAKELGINNAILFCNIHYWVTKNMQNNRNYEDGLFWTYNTQKAYAKQFPYFSERQVQHALKSLEDNGYIKSDRFNPLAYDKTKWYTVTEKGYELMVKAKEFELLNAQEENENIKNNQNVQSCNQNVTRCNEKGQAKSTQNELKNNQKQAKTGMVVDFTKKGQLYTPVCISTYTDVGPIPYNTQYNTHISEVETSQGKNKSKDLKVKANASKKKAKANEEHIISKEQIEIHEYYITKQYALKGCKVWNKEFTKNINELLSRYSLEDIKDMIDFREFEAITKESSREWFKPSTIFRPSNFDNKFDSMLSWKEYKQNKNKKNTTIGSSYVQGNKTVTTYYVWLGNKLTSQTQLPARGTEYFLSEEEALKNAPLV